MGKIPFPGYQQLRPSFQSVKNLWRLAAEQDACFQSSQIAISFLENFIKTYNLDRSDFISKLSELFHISGGHHDWDTTQKSMAYSYIVQTYNVQELFFKGFSQEYQVYKNLERWDNKSSDGSSTKNLDPFASLIKNLEESNAKKIEATPEAKIIQYYRLVRNTVVHSPKEGFEKSTDFFNQKIHPIKEYFHGYFKFKTKQTYPAPNPPKDINHYDFSLYSRSLRYLSLFINDICNLSAKEIFDVEINRPEFVRDMRVYNYITDPNVKGKLEQRLSGYFKTKYGNDPNDIRIFCLEYLSWYGDQNPRKKKSKKPK
jgi:hypothetical protein